LNFSFVRIALNGARLAIIKEPISLDMVYPIRWQEPRVDLHELAKSYALKMDGLENNYLNITDGLKWLSKIIFRRLRRKVLLCFRIFEIQRDIKNSEYFCKLLTIR
jgi:hypothetical protein